LIVTQNSDTVPKLTGGEDVSRTLLLEGPRRLALPEAPSRPLQAGEVRLRALRSAISHGTELNLYRGTSPFGDRAFDRELRAFVPAAQNGAYPQRLGYELVAEVTEIADGVTGLTVGDTVHAGAPHGEEAVLDVAAARSSTYPLVPLPADLPPERALFASVGAVALQAVHDARPLLGDHVLVVGLGAIGLLTVQMARLAGAGRVSAADLDAGRRELALALGADAAIDPATADGGTGAALKRGPGGGADVAIETSGAAAGLQDAIASAVLGGRVVAVGFYQGGAAALRLGEEWHHNRLELISSMGAWSAPHRAYPAWDRQRVMAAVLELLASGRVEVDSLPTRTFPFDRAVDAYRWLDEHPNEAVKVALTYDRSDPS
jgi:2-desacetyl-2-hydroxyethyl bacteriochlorophyllide A dehydrogenase